MSKYKPVGLENYRTHVNLRFELKVRETTVL